MVPQNLEWIIEIRLVGSDINGMLTSGHSWLRLILHLSFSSELAVKKFGITLIQRVDRIVPIRALWHLSWFHGVIQGMFILLQPKLLDQFLVLSLIS